MRDRDSNRPGVVDVLLQLGAMAVVYVAQDPAAAQALRLRTWHTVRRVAWWASAQCATAGLKAERRYDIAKG